MTRPLSDSEKRYKRHRSQLRDRLKRLERALEIERTYVPIPGRVQMLIRAIAAANHELAELEQTHTTESSR